ncbi:hypothetical protein C0992_005289 [Termitomyces sp. T32_za158]|nr:hypothetical protein C0992_005289 [Termitomyces sp. T32_za158]
MFSPPVRTDTVPQFITNTFSVTTPMLTPIGASVSPIVALINHSCEPNAVSLLIDALPSPPTQGSLDDAIRATQRSSTGTTAILPYGHPIRGITFAELGKLLAVDEPSPNQPSSRAEAALIYPPSGPPRLKLALETMLRARSELLVGFGAQSEGGEVGKDARETVVALEKEMAVWKQGVKNVLEDTPRPISVASKS